MLSKKENILKVAGTLLESDGLEALTTRSVQEKAGVTAPTLYYHFKDKDGLLAALIEQGISEFMARKRATFEADDPIALLRQGWDIWLEFAFERPILFRLMADHAQKHPEIMRENYALMRGRLEEMERHDLLSIDIDQAARMIWASSSGLLSLFMHNASKEQILQTSRQLFNAVITSITKRDCGY